MAGGPAVLRFPRGLPPSKQFGERLRLLVVQGNEAGTCYSVLGDTIFIGRDGCQISLNDTNISRRHAELSWKGDHYLVRDLGSSNGILHNGQKVSEAKLSPGDLVLMGLTMFEVYPPGQTKKSDRPVLPGPMRSTLSNIPTTGSANANNEENSAAPLIPQEEKKKREVDRKKMLIYLGLFFVLTYLYLSEDPTTIRENARIPIEEQEISPNQKKLKKSEMEKALREYLPTYALDTQQRRDANVFFRSGVRELQNKNYRRAFTAFETALTVDPAHELAKIYLKTAKKEMMADLKSMSSAGLRAKKSLRYKEARMHFENVVRYLETEDGGSANLDASAKDDMDKLLQEAKKNLKEIEEEEKKI